MTLDSSVMNVSIATVAKDVGTTVTGIQGAITAYTLVMAALMITGAKVGSLLGRTRASRRTTEATFDAYRDARIDGLRSALAIRALLDVVALYLAQRIPTTQPGHEKE